jgi:hypothetical protein
MIMGRSVLNPSGIFDNTLHAQPWMFFPGGALDELFPGRGTRTVGGAPGGAAGGGGAPGGFHPWDRVQSDLDAANAANEGRYQQLLGLADSGKGEELGALKTGYDTMLGAAGKGFDAERAREGQRLQGDLGGVQQSAIDRGLSNTSVRDSMERGAKDDSAMRSLSIDDAQNRQQLAVMQDYFSRMFGATQSANNRKMGIIEGRTDQGPDLGLYANLLRQPGAMGGAGPSLASTPRVVRTGPSGGAPQTFGGGWQRPPQQPMQPMQPQVRPPTPIGGDTQVAGSPTQGNSFSYQTGITGRRRPGVRSNYRAPAGAVL